MMHEMHPKPVRWVGRSLADVRRFPAPVRETVGFAIFQAQMGAKHVSAKPLKGFGGAGVLEIVEDDDGNTYRAVYTVRFKGAIYVLHAFQKKSKQGIKTPKHEIQLIENRLREAAEDYARWRKQHDQN
jgi:phage-related protein